MIGYNIGRMGRPGGFRSSPSWVAVGAAFHIKPRSYSWINGGEFSSFAALIGTPSAASFARASECYALTSAGLFTGFESGIPAVTDLGLLVEPEDTILSGPTIYILVGQPTANGATIEYEIAGPFGPTALRMTANGASSGHYRTATTANVVSGGTYLFWTIAEALSADHYQMVAASGQFGTQVYANFTLTGNGVLGSKGTQTTASGIQKLASGRYLCWMTALATATGAASLSQAIIPASTSGRLAASTSTASAILSAAMVSTATRWGAPMKITADFAPPQVRAAVAFTIRPPSGTYNITYKFGDGTADQISNGVAVSTEGYQIPHSPALNGRFITDIIGVAG